MDRSTFLESFLQTISRWYDITRLGEEDAPLTAAAAFHEHNVSYMFMKSAQMWSTDRHEYAYVFDVPDLTAEVYDKCFNKAYALGEALVNPDEKGHMCTNIVMYFICDRINDDAAQRIRKCRTRKDFQFSLKGWMEVHIAAVCPDSDIIVVNPYGHNEKTFLTRMLHPKKRSGIAGFFSRLLPRRK